MVDVTTGDYELLINRPTAAPRDPETIIEQVAAIVAELGGSSNPVGVTLPCVIRDGVVERAANLPSGWEGCKAADLLRSALGRPVALLNDADAAGLAEMRRGAGVGRTGTVLMLTFGTGVGSALFVDGVLARGTELGHLPIGRSTAEQLAARRVIRTEALSWPQWAARANPVLKVFEDALNPDLIIFGGGISDDAAVWRRLLRTRAERVEAYFRGAAGVVGAALHACEERDAITSQ